MDNNDDDADAVAMIGLVRADGDGGAVRNPSAPQHMRQEMTR
jgi:hypothetical protein